MANNTNIEAKEYEQFMALRTQIEKGIEEAESEFMFQTYKALNRVMNRRQVAATKLNIVLRNKAIAEVAKEKGEGFKAAKAKEKAS